MGSPVILITHFTLEEEMASYRKDRVLYGFIVLNPEVREWGRPIVTVSAFVYNALFFSAIILVHEKIFIACNNDRVK